MHARRWSKTQPGAQACCAATYSQVSGGNSFLFLVLLFCFVRFVEIKDHGVDAVTEACWWRPVVENMPQMGFTAAALYFGTLHAVGIVRRIDYAGFADGLVKTGPAAAAFKFGV